VGSGSSSSSSYSAYHHHGDHDHSDSLVSGDGGKHNRPWPNWPKPNRPKPNRPRPDRPGIAAKSMSKSKGDKSGAGDYYYGDYYYDADYYYDSPDPPVPPPVPSEDYYYDYDGDYDYSKSKGKSKSKLKSKSKSKVGKSDAGDYYYYGEYDYGSTYSPTAFLGMDLTPPPTRCKDRRWRVVDTHFSNALDDLAVTLPSFPTLKECCKDTFPSLVCRYFDVCETPPPSPNPTCPPTRELAWGKSCRPAVIT